MTTRELLRRRREEQVSVFAHTRVYRVYHYTAYSSIFYQFNSIHSRRRLETRGHRRNLYD